MVINTKIKGITFANSEKYVKKLKTGEILSLEREPKNQFDPNAIRILNSQEEFLGYINKELTLKMAHYIDSGATFYAQVINVTGGTEDKPNIGCNIKLISKK